MFGVERMMDTRPDGDPAKCLNLLGGVSWRMYLEGRLNRRQVLQPVFSLRHLCNVL